MWIFKYKKIIGAVRTKRSEIRKQFRKRWFVAPKPAEGEQQSRPIYLLGSAEERAAHS
jgi:hypothetical protein